ncbi:MAG: co-chaperone GroES [Planctomycetota bacterium]|jgi:chaperonin GroES
MAVKVKPLDDRVVVKPLEAETTTSGGIVIPDTAREKPQRGTVVATGPGKMLNSGDRAGVAVKKGDVVLYGKYAGSDIKIGGDEFKILHESDLLGLLE